MICTRPICYCTCWSMSIKTSCIKAEILERSCSGVRQVYNFAGATAHSKLSVLKICNQLLLRLSRASSAELCGRILMFLTRLLPLLDRSGLNVLGQFNTSHSTPVEDVAEVRFHTSANFQALPYKQYTPHSCRCLGLKSSKPDGTLMQQTKAIHHSS